MHRCYRTVFLIIGLYTVPIIGSSLTESSPTLTTLPPALPTGNSTDPCNFTDRYSLIDRVDSDWRGYNVSLLVATCENVCPLVYGAGNPDISGIGAMASYTIQAVVALIFGPLLALLCIIYDVDLTTESDEPLERHSRLLSLAGDLSRSAQTGNILTSLAVLTASIIRIQQLASVGEINFIRFLVQYQGAICFWISASYLITFGRKSARFILLGFYTCTISGMYFAGEYLNGYQMTKVILLDKITWYCVLDWDYPIPALVINEGVGKFMKAFSPIYIGVSVVFMIVFYLVNKYFGVGIRRIYNVMRAGFISLCNRLHVTPKRILFGVCATILAAVSILYAVVYLMILQGIRQKLRRLSGNADQDSEWGFGQITAVLLWAPMINDIILAIFEYLGPRPNPELEQAEAHELHVVNAAQESNLPALPPPAHVRDSHPRSIPNLVSGNRSSNSLRRLSPESLVNGEQGDSHAHNTSDISDTSAGTNLSPPASSISLPTGTSSSGTDFRPQTNVANAGVHQRPTWPRNDAGTYLPTRSTQ